MPFAQRENAWNAQSRVRDFPFFGGFAFGIGSGGQLQLVTICHQLASFLMQPLFELVQYFRAMVASGCCVSMRMMSTTENHQVSVASS